MREWIFKTRGPLDPEQDQAIYIERPEIGHILRLAQWTSVYNYIALFGSRQTGKTSLLYKAKAMLEERGCRVALIDLSGLENQKEAECYRYVSSQILEELGPFLQLREDEWAELASTAGPVDFRSLLLRVAQRTSGPRIVIMLDEVGAIPPAVSDGFFGTIRNVFTSRRKAREEAFGKFVFVFSGAMDLHELTSGRNSPLNICERVYLRDLDRIGVRKLVGNFARKGVVVTREGADYIYHETRGHPYLTQAICALLERQGAQVISREAVRVAIRMLLRGDDHLDRTVRQVAREGEAKKLLRRIVLERQGVPFSRVNPLVARLEIAGVIRGEEYCVVRNPIYLRLLTSYFRASAPRKRARRGAKGDILTTILALLFLVSTPNTWFYVKDILLTESSLSEPIILPDRRVQVFVRYETVIRKGKDHTIEVEVRRPPQVPGPIRVRMEPQQPDIASVDGQYTLLFEGEHQSKHFIVRLAEGFELEDLIKPKTEKREVQLYVETPSASQRYALVLKVGRLTAFLMSAVVWSGSLVIGILSFLWEAQVVRSLSERFRVSEGDS